MALENTSGKDILVDFLKAFDGKMITDTNEPDNNHKYSIAITADHVKNKLVEIVDRINMILFETGYEVYAYQIVDTTYELLIKKIDGSPLISTAYTYLTEITYSSDTYVPSEGPIIRPGYVHRLGNVSYSELRASEVVDKHRCPMSATNEIEFQDREVQTTDKEIVRMASILMQKYVCGECRKIHWSPVKGQIADGEELIRL